MVEVDAGINDADYDALARVGLLQAKALRQRRVVDGILDVCLLPALVGLHLGHRRNADL